jgi:hypothetical protein
LYSNVIETLLNRSIVLPSVLERVRKPAIA